MVALYILESLLVGLLAVVGGLVMWLHFRLQSLLRSNEQAPVLVDRLSNSIHLAQRGIEGLSQSAKTEGKRLDDSLKKADHSIQDLEYMMDRAEKIIKRLEIVLEKAQGAEHIGAVAQVKATPSDTVNITEKSNLTPEQEERSVLLEASRALEVEMKETLSKERARQQAEMQKVNAPSESAQHDDIPEFLLRKEEAESTPKEVVKPHVVSSRPSTPMGGAQAYGRAMEQLSAATDAEDELRRALEGRL